MTDVPPLLSGTIREPATGDYLSTDRLPSIVASDRTKANKRERSKSMSLGIESDTKRKRKEKNAEVRATQTKQQRNAKLESERDRMKTIRSLETEEQRNARLKNGRDKMKNMRALETEEQRNARLENGRDKMKNMRALEAEEQRNARLENGRDRMKTMRTLKTELQYKRTPLTSAERVRATRRRIKERAADAKRSDGTTAPSVAADMPSTSGLQLDAGTTSITDDCTMLSEMFGDGEIIPMECDEQRCEDAVSRWNACNAYFNKSFTENDFGHVCAVCDRLWFNRDLKRVKPKHYAVLQRSFAGCDVKQFKVCGTCLRSLNIKQTPSLSKSNGFSYPPKPVGLPPLDPVSERLVSPRLPFMQIRRLRHEGSYGIVGQVINVPVDVNNMVQQLPRRLDDDFAFNVNIKRNLIHKSVYLGGFVKKSVVKAWLKLLINTPLYKHYNITIDWDTLDSNSEAASGGKENIDYDDLIELMVVDSVPESEVLLSRQHTLLWNEDQCLDIAPGQHNSPINIIYDNHAEELSFPAIYYGVPRKHNLSISVTPYMMATSEIRRSDRRGVTPSHVLYMTMKILRLKVVEGIYNTFRCLKETEKITRKMLEDRQYLDECVEKNLSFLKSIPNSAQYWMSRKKDLFAMIRQLGKPTMFLTMSANEIRWPKLLAILHRLNDHFKDIQVENPMRDLNRSMRSTLVNEDPVTCCIYFNKLMNVIMSMLQTKQRHNPFGDYRVVDYFFRIEFQHRGSPHAHILLWLANDPREQIGEDMPLTVRLVNELCSVRNADLPGEMYGNQVHSHTFTCTKRGEATCRFNIPYWPMDETKVLLPMAKEDNRKCGLQSQAKMLRKLLEEKSYDTLAEFLDDNNMTMDVYLNTIRSTLRRPTLVFRRNFRQIYTNTFHSWIARVLNSNMDLQFILEEYSCATYVVEYVNKSNRGISHLHRELMKLHEEHPEQDYTGLLKKISIKLLNTVEMSAQEGAWYLLRQPMSHCSRMVSFIPTVWPHERQKNRKRNSTMARENLDENSTDIWTKSIVQRYEERPNEMDAVYLAEFVAWYTETRSGANSKRDRNEDAEGDETNDCDDNYDIFEGDVGFHEETSISTATIGNTGTRYSKRKVPRVIRYRNYELDDIVNYKREMVMLYLPFRNEIVDVIDRNKFEGMYNENEVLIMERRKLYESNINIEQVIAEIKTLCDQPDDFVPVDTRDEFVRSVLPEGQVENNDDIEAVNTNCGISAVRQRENVMSKHEYCEMLRSTNREQRELILQVIHRLHSPEGKTKPIQIFFTGPAGCGKTYTLKALMETYNRFTQKHNLMRNAYVACASTGKAAVNLGGTTVHSAFRITQSRRQATMAREVLQSYRNMFVGVKCIIIDEVSMIGSDILHKINLRLQEITGTYDQPFGGLDIIFCGDFRQLPPVNATPVYKSPRNSVGGPVLWQSLDYFPLVQVMRQADTVFAAVLTKIGNGERLEAGEIKLIESRFRTKAWCDANVPHAVRLFHKNHCVDVYNRDIIRAVMENMAIDVILGYKTTAESVKARQKLHKMSVAETGGLPYLLKLATGYPYMITTNIDVEDGLVNGAIGLLKYIELMNEDITDREQEENIRSATNNNGDDASAVGDIRLWIEFPNTVIGRKRRVKTRPHVMCKSTILSRDWTPINTRMANISLDVGIKCKRRQFPLVPACALTIHKSQGGTFDEVVYQYDRSQQTQLVYVAMSRVTSLQGLYMTNSTNDFKFHHGYGSATPTIKEIRDEYARMANHRLQTLTERVERFIETTTPSHADNNGKVEIIACSLNTQSLVAHSRDMTSDTVISGCDYLICNETWMDESLPPINIEGFECEVHNNNKRLSVADKSINVPPTKRKAGGVCIYRNIRSLTNCNVITRVDNRMCNDWEDLGDMCMVSVQFKNQFKFLLGSIYIHPGVSQSSLQYFMSMKLNQYLESVKQHIRIMCPDTETPMVLCGDFNVDMAQNKNFLEFMKRKFNMDCVQNSPSTLGNTCLDLTFTRNVNVSCMPYVTYFSYHRPIMNKIVFDA